MKPFLLAVLAFLLLLPTPCRADADPVARGGSAFYPGFEVSLDGAEGLHHVHLAFEAQCMDAKGAELAASPRAKEAVILLLRGKTAAELATPRGKRRLKTDLVKALNAAIGSPRVVQVLLRQFVVF